MKISHGTKHVSISDTNGYGYATDRMLDSLTRLGHEVKQNDPDAQVQIWFDQVEHWEWNRNRQYRIGYHPWESTKLKPGWVDRMNKCDEIWTPSPLIAEWYRADGVKVPVYTYLHGVDKIWSPQPRKIEDKIRFLHLGTEAARKGGMEVMRAFRKAFPRRNDVELTLKMNNPGWNIPFFGKNKIMNEPIGLNELVDLFHNHHVYVYPSWGEGFGLTPLQAMATGMPTITVPDWAVYENHLDPRLNIKSRLAKSPWPDLHPGKMFMPSLSDMIDRMRWVVDNYDSAHQFAMSQTAQIFDTYDWDKQTKKTFDALEKRLENS